MLPEKAYKALKKICGDKNASLKFRDIRVESGVESGKVIATDGCILAVRSYDTNGEKVPRYYDSGECTYETLPYETLPWNAPMRKSAESGMSIAVDVKLLRRALAVCDAGKNTYGGGTTRPILFTLTENVMRLDAITSDDTRVTCLIAAVNPTKHGIAKHNWTDEPVRVMRTNQQTTMSSELFDLRVRRIQHLGENQ